MGAVVSVDGSTQLRTENAHVKRANTCCAHAVGSLYLSTAANLNLNLRPVVAPPCRASVAQVTSWLRSRLMSAMKAGLLDENCMLLMDNTVSAMVQCGHDPRHDSIASPSLGLLISLA